MSIIYLSFTLTILIHTESYHRNLTIHFRPLIQMCFVLFPCGLTIVSLLAYNYSSLPFVRMHRLTGRERCWTFHYLS